MNINSINNVDFRAIKYTRALPPTAGKVLDKEAKGTLENKLVTSKAQERLKSIVNSSPLLKKLGEDTDVYIGSQCYDESKKNPFWVFVATFMDPYAAIKAIEAAGDEAYVLGELFDGDDGVVIN